MTVRSVAAVVSVIAAGAALLLVLLRGCGGAPPAIVPLAPVDGSPGAGIATARVDAIGLRVEREAEPSARADGSARAAPDRHTFLVVGRVVDAGTAQPIAGANVLSGSPPASTLRLPHDPAPATTDASGRFVIDAASAGSHLGTPGGHVIVSASGYAERVVSLLPGGMAQRVDVGTVELRPRPLRVVRVTDDAGRPVVGAAVHVVDRRQPPLARRIGAFTGAAIAQVASDAPDAVTDHAGNANVHARDRDSELLILHRDCVPVTAVVDPQGTTEVVLRRTQAVEVTATRDDGLPVHGPVRLLVRSHRLGVGVEYPAVELPVFVPDFLAPGLRESAGFSVSVDDAVGCWFGQLPGSRVPPGEVVAVQLRANGRGIVLVWEVGSEPGPVHRALLARRFSPSPSIPGALSVGRAAWGDFGTGRLDVVQAWDGSFHHLYSPAAGFGRTPPLAPRDVELRVEWRRPLGVSEPSSVTVVDDAGSPVAAARVAVRMQLPPAEWPALDPRDPTVREQVVLERWTGPEGVADLGWLPATELTVLADHPEFARSRVICTNGSRTTRHTVVLRRGGTLRIGLPDSLPDSALGRTRLTVTDDATSMPRYVTPRSDGVTLEQLAPGPWQIEWWAAPDDFAAAFGVTDVAAATASTIRSVLLGRTFARVRAGAVAECGIELDARGVAADLEIEPTGDRVESVRWFTLTAFGSRSGTALGRPREPAIDVTGMGVPIRVRGVPPVTVCVELLDHALRPAAWRVIDGQVRGQALSLEVRGAATRAWRSWARVRAGEELTAVAPSGVVLDWLTIDVDPDFVPPDGDYRTTGGTVVTVTAGRPLERAEPGRREGGRR